MTKTFDPHVIARILKGHDIPTSGVSEIDDLADGNIDITDKIHVQVGYNYLSINVFQDDFKILMGEPIEDVGELIAQLTELIK